MTSRRTVLKYLGGLTAVPLIAATAGRASTRPNIVFVMTDDHANRALSCYGSRINRTPNLDRLAREGMRLNNCFVTNSLCAPSRATVLTGKYSHLHGVKTNRDTFDGTQETFPKLLQSAGYQTAMVGKWHLKSDPTGFDYWNVLPGQGAYFNPDLIEMGQRKNYSGYVTDIITDLAIDFLDTGNREQPFFLSIGHKAPHRSWRPPAKYEDLYEGKRLPVPETLFDDYTNRASPAAHANLRILENMGEYSAPSDLSGRDQLRHKYQQYIKDYLGTIQSVDDNMGRLLDYLDSEGLAHNTLVIYTSDNGFFLGEHGWFDKRFMYEESLKIPLLVRYPGKISARSVSDALVMNLDFAETILDYAGITAPEEMQGHSLRPTLEGRTPDNRRSSVYYHYYEYPGPHTVRPHHGVRTQRYKLINYYSVGERELFDLEKDPHEMRNLYHQSAYQGIRRGLEEESDYLREYYKDQEPGEVSGTIGAETPGGFHLFQNHPNPFNSSTLLTFRVPREIRANLSVYSLNGSLVRTLLDQRISGGRHSLQWNGVDSAGLPVASGSYICRLKGEEYTESILVSVIR